MPRRPSSNKAGPTSGPPPHRFVPDEARRDVPLGPHPYRKLDISKRDEMLVNQQYEASTRTRMRRLAEDLGLIDPDLEGSLANGISFASGIENDPGLRDTLLEIQRRYLQAVHDPELKVQFLDRLVKTGKLQINPATKQLRIEGGLGNDPWDTTEYELGQEAGGVFGGGAPGRHEDFRQRYPGLAAYGENDVLSDVMGRRVFGEEEAGEGPSRTLRPWEYDEWQPPIQGGEYAPWEGVLYPPESMNFQGGPVQPFDVPGFELRPQPAEAMPGYGGALPPEAVPGYAPTTIGPRGIPGFAVAPADRGSLSLFGDQGILSYHPALDPRTWFEGAEQPTPQQSVLPSGMTLSELLPLLTRVPI